MSTILTQTRPFNLETTNAIPNGDVGYTKPVGLVYVTFFARSGEHEIFVFDNNQWVLHETLAEGQFKNIKMENISQFYVRCKVASGSMRISPKIDKSANTALKQDLKYGKALAETSSVSQKRPESTDILKASGSEISLNSDISVSVQYSEISVFPTINSVSLETVDSDVYLVTVNGENLTKDTQLYIYDSQIDDSVAQSLSAGYLDENDSNIGEVVDLVAYSIYPEKPEPSSFGSLEFIPEEGVVCVNPNQTFGAKNPISFISSYEMKIAMKGVLGVNSYSVFAKDDNGSFLHKGSFSLDISNETEEISPEGTFTAYNDAVIDGETITLDGNGDYAVYDGPFRFSDQFTISTWFKSNGNMANLDTIFSNHDGGGVANGNTISLNPDGTLRVKTLDSGTGTNGDALNIGSNLADGNWHQLVLTWQANTTNGRKVYVDGQLIHQNNSGTPNAWRTDAGSKTYIGALWLYTTNQLLPDNFFNGQIKNFNIVNSITTAQEVADDYANNDPTPVIVPTSANLEESYLDSNDVQTPTIMQQGGRLLNGIYIDSLNSNSWAQGDFSDDLRPLEVTDEFSFSGYYRFLNSTNGELWLMTVRNNSNGWRVVVQKNSDTSATIFVSYNGTHSYISTGNTVTTSLNEFHHVAMTSYNGTMKLYHDGVEVKSLDNKPFLPGAPADNMYTVGEGAVKAAIDEINVYKGTLLTPSEIQTLAAEVTTKDAEYEQATIITTFGNASISNDLITFDGDGDYAIYDGEHRYTDQISISAWFKTTATGERTIYSSHVRSYSQFYNGFFGKVTNGTLRIRTPDGGGGESSHGSGLNDGEWHHMAVTWETNTSGGKKVYIDGALVSTANTSTANGYAPDWDLYIGAIPWSGNNPYSFFDGQIANFNLTNSIVTGQEVYNDYVNNNPTPGYTPPDPNSVPSPDLYFDGSSTDAQVGTNSFSLGGAVLSTSKGKYGSDSFDFGSTGNKMPLQLSTGLNLSSKIYTFSLWFYNKRTVNNWGAVIRGTTNNFPIITKYPNTDELGNYSGSFRGTGFMMTQFEDLQEWTHLVVVANGSTSTYYVNGQQAGDPVDFVVGGIVNQFGSHNGGTIQTFAEAMDEIAYWETALSAQQVALIYNSSEKLYTPEYDQLITYGDASLSNGIYSLDGNGDYLVYDGPFRYTDKFTISTWFKADPNMTDPYIIFSNHDAGGVSNGTVVSMDTSGVLKARLPDSGTGNTGVEQNIGTGLNDGNWHQLVVTWEANTTGGRKIYVDGQLLREANSGAANAYRTSAQSLFYVGAIWNYVTNQFSTSNWFKGEVANISVENEILTSEQIAAAYIVDSPE